MSNMREEGFYWTQDKTARGGEPQVRQWSMDRWWSVDDVQPGDDDVYLILSSRLREPPLASPYPEVSAS